MNCEGFNRNSDYVLTTHRPTFVCIQETWLLDEGSSKISCIHNDYVAFSKSGVDSRDKILQGRAPGGVSILYRKDMCQNITQIPVNSRRMCAAKLTCSDDNGLVIVCVYMPCNSLSMTIVNPEYEDVLNEIEVLTCKYDQYQVVLCGDFNTSFERNTAQSKKLDNFIQGNNHGLFVSWDYA